MIIPANPYPLNLFPNVDIDAIKSGSIITDSVGFKWKVTRYWHATFLLSNASNKPTQQHMVDLLYRDLKENPNYIEGILYHFEDIDGKLLKVIAAITENKWH